MHKPIQHTEAARRDRRKTGAVRRSNTSAGKRTETGVKTRTGAETQSGIGQHGDHETTHKKQNSRTKIKGI